MLDAIQNELTGDTMLDVRIILFRLPGSLSLTGLIGIEREAHERPAGLRTHMLVGLAATGYCLVTLELIAWDHGDEVRLDPIRLVEAVTGGVAFLAAGLIVFARGKIRGLTTGASLWLAASVGLSVGLGLWPLAVALAAGALLVTWILRIVEDRVDRSGK
jgi:Uncharacterized membrane protein